ncbi:HAD family acid phosphatase, partial [Escherichia coli]
NHNYLIKRRKKQINTLFVFLLSIIFGDSDNDITAARDVGARGIRILRASNSTYKPLPQAGAFGEEVIVNSEY